MLLTLVGGGLDAYTFIGRNGVFANAQSGNIVLMGVAAAQGYWRQALNHLPPIIAFVTGSIAAESLRRPKVVALVLRPVRAALGLEIAVLAVVGFIPRTAPDILVTVMIAFTASVQASTFRTLVDTKYITTMTTGNLRSGARNAYLALVDHDTAAARRARQFGVIVLAFALGALGGARLTATEGPHAVWVGAVLLLAGLFLFVHDEHTAARKRTKHESPVGARQSSTIYSATAAPSREAAKMRCSGLSGTGRILAMRSKSSRA
ncbi:YoaK family protein [Streptomyces sp. RLB3-6]|uniref:YoaK family protein n=1 Tax=Streptomyces sp. RLB3-6 TaxID=2594457 RepID=UPI001967BDF5|nr:YoaK family protein [Streptomyces sp. RLB3-6]